jgi:hypothetical protein
VGQFTPDSPFRVDLNSETVTAAASRGWLGPPWPLALALAAESNSKFTQAQTVSVTMMCQRLAPSRTDVTVQVEHPNVT